MHYINLSTPETKVSRGSLILRPVWFTGQTNLGSEGNQQKHKGKEAGQMKMF